VAVSITRRRPCSCGTARHGARLGLKEARQGYGLRSVGTAVLKIPNAFLLLLTSANVMPGPSLGMMMLQICANRPLKLNINIL